jgi:hypothetical protein
MASKRRLIIKSISAKQRPRAVKGSVNAAYSRLMGLYHGRSRPPSTTTRSKMLDHSG